MNMYYVYGLLCLIMSQLNKMENDAKQSGFAMCMTVLWFCSAMMFMVVGVFKCE